MRHLWPVLGLVLVLALTLSWWQGRHRDAALQRADSLAVVARVNAGEAATWRRLYDSAQARVDTVVRIQRIRDIRVDSVLVEVRGQPIPEGCEGMVANHRAALDSVEASRDGWRASYEGQVQATAMLRRSHAALDTAYTRLSAAYTIARRPGPRRLRIEPAAFGGLCTDGRACAGLGVTLTWRR